jgi:hypothetical protein
MHYPIPPSLVSPWRYKDKMATPEQKAFCVLQFAKYESVVSLQRVFGRQFQSDPQSANSIRRWYQQFQTKGCLCKGKSTRRLRAPEESVERVRQSFLRSPKKSVCHASRELEMSTMTVWGVLRKRLEMKPYRLHLVQFLQSFWYTVYTANFCFILMLWYFFIRNPFIWYRLYLNLNLPRLLKLSKLDPC